MDSPRKRGRRDLQPRSVAALRSSDEQWLVGHLAEFDELAEARRLERIAEEEIITLLQLQAFDRRTPEWRTVASALIEYGYSVFMAWTVTGVVRHMAARHAGGRGVNGLARLPERLQLTHDDAHALVADLIATSVEAFRTRTLMDPRRTWRADGGASLKTYFVGRCLMELPDAYERWERAERFSGLELLDSTDDGRHGQDVESAGVADVRIDELVDIEVRVMFELQLAGYSLLEIADVLTEAGYAHTEGSVRTRMSLARKSAKAS